MLIRAASFPSCCLVLLWKPTREVKKSRLSNRFGIQVCDSESAVGRYACASYTPPISHET